MICVGDSIRGRVNPALEILEHAFNFDLATGDQLLAMPVGIKALLEREEMFAPIIANQAACNRVSASPSFATGGD